MEELNIAVPMEVFSIGSSGIQAVMETVEDTTDVIDDGNGRSVRTRPVPGWEGESYVPWGADNQLPYRLQSLVMGDEVTAQNKLFNVQTCYGAGVQLKDTTSGEETTDKDIRRWRRSNNIPMFALEQMTDMKHFYFCVAVIILSKDGQTINRLHHKDACYCRLQQADRKGCIKYVYFANWNGGTPQKSEIERIPLLDLHDPFGDLMVRMGREAGADGRSYPRTRDRKFAILMRFPTVGCRYYPVPYWSAIFRGGSYDEKRLISVGKRAKLRNSTSVKYQVEVAKDYWERILREEKIIDPVKAKERIKREKENIRNFVSGIENAGKVWISGYYVDPNGREIHDILIKSIDKGKSEGGDWMEDVQAAANTISFADGVHSNLVGTVPGKAQMNNSGSDKRELFTMKQALEVSWHDILLMPLRIVCWYNGWENIEPTIPMIQLTTLDEHRDAKVAEQSETNNQTTKQPNN